MVTIAYLLLALAVILLVLFLFIKSNRLKRLTLFGFALFYVLFFAISFYNHKISLANINDVDRQSAKVEEQLKAKDSSPKVINKTATEAPVINDKKPLQIAEHGVFSGKLGQKLVIKFTLTNNSGQDIDNFIIVFNQSGFSNLMSINAIKPNARINRNTFIFGRMTAGSTQDYTIETYPVRTGSYESAVSFKNGDQTIMDKNNNQIQDYIKVNIN